MTEPALTVEVQRHYKASREAIFSALTDPALLPGWFSPSKEISMRVLDLDLREGGRYRFAYTLPDGQVTVVTGEYRQVSPPEKLTFTWTWEDPDRMRESKLSSPLNY